MPTITIIGAGVVGCAIARSLYQPPEKTNHGSQRDGTIISK